MTRNILPGQYVQDKAQPWRRGIFQNYSHSGTRATVLTHRKPRRLMYIRRELLKRELKAQT